MLSPNSSSSSKSVGSRTFDANSWTPVDGESGFLSLIGPPKPQCSSAIRKFCDGIEVNFTEHNKISLDLLLQRVDYHLTRVMKNHRVRNFKNAIKNYSMEDQVCESVLEIINSTERLISRRRAMIQEAYDLYQMCVDNRLSAPLASMVGRIHYVQNHLEQFNWAINGNRGHLKWVATVFTVPYVYHRHSPTRAYPLRKMLIQNLKASEAVSQIVLWVRFNMCLQFLERNISDLSNEQNQQQRIQQHLQEEDGDTRHL